MTSPTGSSTPSFSPPSESPPSLSSFDNLNIASSNPSPLQPRRVETSLIQEVQANIARAERLVDNRNQLATTNRELTFRVASLETENSRLNEENAQLRYYIQILEAQLKVSDEEQSSSRKRARPSENSSSSSSQTTTTTTEPQVTTNTTSAPPPVQMTTLPSVETTRLALQQGRSLSQQNNDSSNSPCLPDQDNVCVQQ